MWTIEDYRWKCGINGSLDPSSETSNLVERCHPSHTDSERGAKDLSVNGTDYFGGLRKRVVLIELSYETSIHFGDREAR
jgi:hypothetical protein